MKVDNLLRYFDLASASRPEGPEPVADQGAAPGIPQYAALFLGIAVEPLFDSYRTTHVWNFGAFPGWLLFSVIVAVLIFPAVYKNAYEPTRPIFVQLCSIFASGIGWQALLQTAVKAGALAAS